MAMHQQKQQCVQQMQHQRQMTVQQQQEQDVRTLSLVKNVFKSFMDKSEQ